MINERAAIGGGGSATFHIYRYRDGKLTFSKEIPCNNQFFEYTQNSPMN
jgi:hypothetical protein